jgi:hypothetical protein
MVLPVGFEVLTAVSMKIVVFWAVLVSPDHVHPRLPIASLASPVSTYSPLVRPVSLHWMTYPYITARFLSPGLLIALMMEAARTSETLVNFYQTTRCYNPEDSNLQWFSLSQKDEAFEHMEECRS